MAVEAGEPDDRYDVVNYTPHPANVTRARRRVARLVADWGHPEAAGDTALLASELITNAVRHGCLRDRLFRVELFLRSGPAGGCLRIAVSDPKGERRPLPRSDPDHHAESGRGLHIIGALATRWGVADRTVGKTVWAELDTSRSADA
ncbi:ATP-binding protein [Streptomyces celluloflavus]|uniref:ATP-binding protein n=1 Tax=Streptomyces celluloflavus TaxID=58344 RepID=A0ABW7REW7_9ACTN|nr:ATP-binding protein [Streptomyces celluloflavus]